MDNSLEFNKIAVPPSPIGYKVVLQVESYEKRTKKLKQSGTVVSEFNQSNPFDARIDAFALTDGWKLLLDDEGENGGREYTPNFHPYSIKKDKTKDAEIHIYRIKIYCVDEFSFEDINERLIRDTYFDKIVRYAYNTQLDEINEGLEWEKELYRQNGININEIKHEGGAHLDPDHRIINFFPIGNIN